MPLLRRRPVPLLPLPSLDGLSPSSPVFYLKATGEVFLDYDSYAARLTFLLTRQFQCEYSGKSGLDYFAALRSEKAESKVVRERFPDALKGKVLGSVQFQVMGRLDSLVDLVYDRYRDRYFRDEKVFVDIAGDKYFALISNVFPPQNIRDQVASSPAPSSSSTDTPSLYASAAHKTGVDMNIDPKTARAEDDPDEYLYTLQLMDEEGKFEGSTMEVKHRSLSRDRLAFSKSILKRYLRECLTRDASIGAPWIVKPSIARAFSIPLEQSGTIEERNRKAREAKLAKRRKAGEGVGGAGGAKEEGEGRQAPAKRRKTVDGSATPASSSTPLDRAATTGSLAESRKPVKYPIEDLDLDPMSIIDGRVLRRVNSELPTLPPKPQPKRDLLVPEDNFDRFIETWTMLNVFSKALNISPFSLDDYAGALDHPHAHPRCTLLTEIHASLTNIIGTDNSRVLGSTTAVPSYGRGGPAAAAAAAAATGGEEPGTPAAEGDDQLAEAGAAGGERDGTVEYEHIPYEESELNKLVRLGISHAKRWDRQAKLKSADKREGWEKHLIGALCQRGGPVHMPNFVRIMRHLFKGHPALPKQDWYPGDDDEEEEQAEDVKPKKEQGEDAEMRPPATLTAKQDQPDADVDQLGTPPPAAADSPSTKSGEYDAEPQYFTLALEDKLDIVAYLCTLVMGSKVVRSFVDESDARLTELRKAKADVNKEKKALIEKKAILDAGGKVDPAAFDAASATPVANGTATPSVTPAAPPATTANGSRAPSEATETTPSRAASVKPSAPGAGAGGDEDEEEDQLASDDDDERSVAPSEAGSISYLSRKQAQLEEKRLEKLQEQSGARAGSVASGSGTPRGRTLTGGGAGAKDAPRAPPTIEDLMRQNAHKDDFVDREFRRYHGVARCRPLGKDRFHCRYWWFDGIGGMDLVVPNGAGEEQVVYGTGRLFVQGPSEEDWEVIADVKEKGEEGEKSARERRMKEEVVDAPEALLGVNEWAYYEDDEELDSLVAWLNSKGTRELALKTAIQKWRPLLTAGAQQRRYDAANPDLPRYEVPPGKRRASRKDRQDPEPDRTYMGWRNQIARF
ncbi:DDT domain-containing protein [Rhodotorula toruloides]|uniref:DDT domain-containing protein n=1 Tax=Rhodotorula toruloides TaxID=5286 RepID=A0A511KSD2_RHOTO|nr:DDT domain-containing protein [Rhodotorula toruloides]